MAVARPVQDTVAAQGLLGPVQGGAARVAPVLSGRIQSVNVREGEHVTAGEIVAVMDHATLDAQTASAAAAAQTASIQAQEAALAAKAGAADQASSVRLAGLALDAARKDRANSVAQARLTLDTAQTDLHKTEAGARPQEIAQAEQVVLQNQATRDRTASEVVRVHSLLTSGIDSQRQLDDAKTAETIAGANLAASRQALALLRAGARPEDLQAAKLRVKQAEAALAAAQADGSAQVAKAAAALVQAHQAALQVRVKQQDVIAMTSAAAQKQADMRAATVADSYCQVCAPLSGIVVKRYLNPGDMADSSTPILQIGADTALDLQASLPADEASVVAPGQKASVSIDGIKSAVAGLVTTVGQVDAQTGLLSVRIRVDNRSGVLRSGQFATARIVVKINPHGVLVPRNAIVNSGGQPAVFVVGADNTAHHRDVQLGPDQGNGVEVRSGVSAGEQVVTTGAWELDEGVKVQPHVISNPERAAS
ncbi:MAG: efflux RND transporter periplasmic adaptor subunit [Armatimonadetes bacterium]|nr:efflux RND transporter periplasmic adaptor subunit [Armatimonadota bacterium]MDE2205172.1 efflux RND transporter periplasmic adaptor subunit [Armatimonadota bacterium]